MAADLKATRCWTHWFWFWVIVALYVPAANEIRSIVRLPNAVEREVKSGPAAVTWFEDAPPLNNRLALVVVTGPTLMARAVPIAAAKLERQHRRSVPCTCDAVSSRLRAWTRT